MVVLNRIYTRTGDDGTTALGSGERRPKYDLRISAYGTVDETNAAIGVVRLHLGDARELDAMLGRIQNDLFDLGADLAVPQRDGKAERLRMLSSQVERLERDIDALNEHLAPLTSFVLPGGTPAVTTGRCRYPPVSILCSAKLSVSSLSTVSGLGVMKSLTGRWS